MKIIIVEDEFLAQQGLSWLIKEYSQMEIIGAFDDGLDVLKFLQYSRIDAIFLDINIPSLDGVLLARNISRFAHKPFTMFITAQKEHTVEAFELEAFDYILEPYQESRAAGMLQKLEAAWQQQQVSSTPAATVTHESSTINLVKDERMIATPISGIYYTEAHEKMTSVYTQHESYVVSMNITKFCNRLPPSHFFRYHRPSCISLSKICEIEPRFNNTYILRLKDLDPEVPVGRSEVKEFRQLMHLQSGTFMKASGLSTDQQFFAGLLSGLMPNPQLLGRVRFASQPASSPMGSLHIDFPRLDIVPRGEYGNLLEAKQQRTVGGEILLIPARVANLSINNKPVVLLGLVFTPTWLGLSFCNSRTTSLLHPAHQTQLLSL